MTTEEQARNLRYMVKELGTHMDDVSMVDRAMLVVLWERARVLCNTILPDKQLDGKWRPLR